MTEAPNPASSPVVDQPQLGRLAKLHRMSRTAGAGSTDYAAVNTMAVVAVVLGLVSFLAMLDPLFLFVPVVTLVISVAAFRQVRASNGTQTGMALALAGMLLGVGFAGVTGVRYLKIQQEKSNNIRALGELAESFGQKLAKSDYAGAYSLFDARLKERMSLQQFEAFFATQFEPGLGRVTSVKSNGLFDFEKDADTGLTMAKGMALVQTVKVPEGTPPMRPEVVYRRSSDDWQIFNIPEWVNMAAPAPKPGAGGGSGGAPAGPAGPPNPAGAGRS